MIGHAFPNSVKDAPEVVRQTKRADVLLAVQSNVGNTYEELGRTERALQMKRDVYSGSLELYGIDNDRTLTTANNYATSLGALKRYQEARSLLRKTIPVAQRVRGESDALTLSMRTNYARALCYDPTATLGDLSEAVTTLEEVERIARRVFGGAHEFTGGIEKSLQIARAALRAREAPGGGA